MICILCLLVFPLILLDHFLQLLVVRQRDCYRLFLEIEVIFVLIKLISASIDTKEVLRRYFDTFTPLVLFTLLDF